MLVGVALVGAGGGTVGAALVGDEGDTVGALLLKSVLWLKMASVGKLTLFGNGHLVKSRFSQRRPLHRPPSWPGTMRNRLLRTLSTGRARVTVPSLPLGLYPLYL